jgi:hypothetical protein
MPCFTESANSFYIFQLCMYIVFILQCQRAQYNFQIVYKEQKQASLIFFASVLFDMHTYTVAISYCRST